MTDRSIVVRLRAEVGQFKQQMGEAAKATQQIGQQATKSARDNREAWTTAGVALTAYGAGVAALGGSLLKTGIAYNQLRQQSTAALTTLLGSTKAAADQMDRLDEFARTSPFARQTFITAQQQLIGFGVEASKVLPMLDAIQNAVASFGGSNQQIEEIAYVMAQISAAGKITATDLMQLGQRGVDAATLIGSQMGMTGAEIRESITAGSLGASEALDALTAGMAEKFDGAAENVKGTFAGALDRMKAAWRDLGSELATPLVDPNGGGLLVDLANSAADAARAFQDLSPETKALATSIVGVSGAASLMGGAFLLLFPRVMDAKAGMATLRSDMPRLGGAIDRVTLSVAGLSAAFLVAKSAGAFLDRGRIASVNEFATAFSKLEMDAAGAAKKLEALANVGVMDSWLDQVNTLGGLLDSGQSSITNDIKGIADAVSSLDMSRLESVGNWFAGLTRETRADAGANVIRSIDEALAQMVTSGNLVAAGEGAAYFAEQAAKSGKSSEEAAAMLPAYNEALRGLEAAGTDTSAAVSEYAREAARAAAASEAEAQAIQTAVDAMRSKRTAALAAIDAEIGYRASIDAARKAVKENGRELDLNTNAGRANMGALLDLAQSWNNLSDRQKNAQGSARQARETFVEMATSMGMSEEKARRLASRLLEIKPRNVKVTVDTASAASQLESFIRTASGRMISLGTRVVANSSGLPAPIARATGGPVYGPGTKTSDSIPAMLSAGEYVVRAAAVDHYGTAFFDQANSMRLAAGGYVNPSFTQSAYALASGGPVVRLYRQDAA